MSQDLEKRALNALIVTMPEQMLALLRRLLSEGYPLFRIRSVVVAMIRKRSGQKHTLTELSVEEYLDRVADGRIPFPPQVKRLRPAAKGGA